MMWNGKSSAVDPRAFIREQSPVSMHCLFVQRFHSFLRIGLVNDTAGRVWTIVPGSDEVTKASLLMW